MSESNITDIVLKALLFLGLFAIAGQGGKNEYKFDLGLNLSIVLVVLTVIIAFGRLIELKLKIIIQEESK